MPDFTPITIQIESAESGREHVSLEDFTFQLDALKKVLANAESSLSGEQAKIDWQIVALKHSSPAQVVLCPFSPSSIDRFEDKASQTIDTVIYHLKALSGLPSQRHQLTKISPKLLEHYEHFGKRVLQGNLKVSLKSESDKVRVRNNLKEIIEPLTLPETKLIGTVEGRMEYVNIHGGQNRFRIYSKIPPEQVFCSFSPDKMEEAREALGRKVKIFGELTYPRAGNFPKSVEVETIELIPEDDDLPSIMDLRGIAPDITGDLYSEEHVRDLRDAE